MQAAVAAELVCQTSTGFGTEERTIVDVRLMKELWAMPASKSFCGIKTYEVRVPMLEAGATRIGASAGEL